MNSVTYYFVNTHLPSISVDFVEGCSKPSSSITPASTQTELKYVPSSISLSTHLSYFRQLFCIGSDVSFISHIFVPSFENVPSRNPPPPLLEPILTVEDAPQSQSPTGSSHTMEEEAPQFINEDDEKTEHVQFENPDVEPASAKKKGKKTVRGKV